MNQFIRCILHWLSYPRWLEQELLSAGVPSWPFESHRIWTADGGRRTGWALSDGRTGSLRGMDAEGIRSSRMHQTLIFISWWVFILYRWRMMEGPTPSWNSGDIFILLQVFLFRGTWRPGGFFAPAPNSFFCGRFKKDIPLLSTSTRVLRQVTN